MWLGAQLAYGRNRASKMGRRPGWTNLAQSNMTISLELTRSQILAFRRRAAALDERLPHGQHALRHAAWVGLQDSMPRAALLSIHARMAATESGSWEDASIVRDRKTLPPEISLYGARPNQEQTCFTAGKRSISVPISLCASVALCDNNPSHPFQTQHLVRIRCAWLFSGASGGICAADVCPARGGALQ